MALAATSPVASDYTRLHLTPFGPALLSAILAPSLLSDARNISYHSLQTFPEKGFGFVDLPRMEAEKLKKKLNGTILRGAKLKIEEAHPPKQLPPGDETAPTSKIDKDKVEKRKRDTLGGVELHDRKVKRGWTEPITSKKLGKKSKENDERKKSLRSRYSSGPECLFRMTVPTIAAAAVSNGDSTLESDAGSKRRRLSKSRKNTVIHEFSKTVKHASFLRSNNISPERKMVFEYVDGKGWVDDAGNILEPEIADKNKNSKQALKDAVGKSRTDRIAGDRAKAGNKEALDDAVHECQSASDSEEEDSAVPAEGDKDDSKSNQGVNESLSSCAAPVGLKLVIPADTKPKPDPISVHPLEALFKRRPQPLPKFSFFGSDADDHDGDEATEQVPLTPFTRQDITIRSIRSAAPTPDTACPGKTYLRWHADAEDLQGNGYEHDDDRDGTDGLSDSPSHQQGKAEDEERAADEGNAKDSPSDFQKWFYEHRGETSRAWKKRRKMAAKEKRYRENKKSERKP